MILQQDVLNQRMSVDVQKWEIKRLKKTSAGAILFITQTYADNDVIETLLSKSNVKYTKSVRGVTITYRKKV